MLDLPIKDTFLRGRGAETISSRGIASRRAIRWPVDPGAAQPGAMSRPNRRPLGISEGPNMRRYLAWLAAGGDCGDGTAGDGRTSCDQPHGDHGVRRVHLFSEITPGDPTSAYLNLGFTAVAPIASRSPLRDSSPIATYGN